jgi:uncharacterized protein (DUF58 family)
LWVLLSRYRVFYSLGPFWFRAGDLFGFFSSEKRWDEYALILVYPRLVPVRPLTLPRRDFFGRAGGKSAVKDPVYIQGTQDYQPGQPSRHIHWKASARHVRLQSKVFEPSSQEKILMVLQVDQFAEADTEEPFERTIEVIASLAVNLGSQGYAVGFVTNGTIQGGGDYFLQVSRHPRQVSKILETLARVQLPPGIGMLELLRPGLRSVSTPSVISFVHHADERTRRVADYFRICGMPSTTFTYEPLRGTVNKKTAILNFRHLKEICVLPLENEGAGQSSGGPPVCSP